MNDAQDYLFSDIERGEDEGEGGSVVNWNPWHGCTKYSAGCANCYVYRQDAKLGLDSSVLRKTKTFSLPVDTRKNGAYKVKGGAFFYTCFSSDFLHHDADAWRKDAWRMMSERADCRFLFFTKRIERFLDCVPSDWGAGYDNVTIGSTCENQAAVERRLPLFLKYPCRHKIIIHEPILSAIDISAYLDDSIEEVVVGGESGSNARPCRWEWVLSIRAQCVKAGVPFTFRQTGARFIKDGRLYNIPRILQRAQAQKAGVDTR